MKKLLLALTVIATVTFMGCDESAEYDSNMCYQSVRNKYPNARIYHEPGSTVLYWVVIDTNGTYYRVKTGTDQVTNVVKQTELK